MKHLVTLLALLLALLPAPAMAGGDLNGTTGYWELASDLGFDGDANFPITVSAWIRPDTVSGVDVIFCLMDLNTDTEDMATFDLNSGVATNRTVDSFGVLSSAVASKTCTAGRWYHVVAVLSDARSEAFIWVDGSFVGGGSGTNRSLADLDTTTIGCSWSNAPAAQRFFDGVITDVTVWSVALTEKEIQGITMCRSAAIRTRPSSIVLHIPDESINGTVCVDRSGGGAGIRAFTKNGTIADASDGGPSGFTPPALGSWTPSDLSPAVWLKGDAGVTGTAPVTAWADQSGNGNDLDNTGTGAPAAVTTGKNGKVGVNLDNASLYGEPAPVTAAPFYVLGVWTCEDLTSNTTLWIGDKDLNDNECWQAAGGFTLWQGITAAGATDTATLAGTDTSLLTGIEVDEASTTSRRASRAAGQQGVNAGSSAPIGPDRYSLGRREDSTPDRPSSDGTGLTVYELVITTTAPTDAQRCLWFTYIRNRWNVSSGPWRYQ